MSLPLRFLARTALREARSLLGRGALFVACLATGVAAIVGVAGLADAIEDGLRVKARELLAADVLASSRRELPPELEAAARAIPGARVAPQVETYSMATAGGRSQLVELKAVGPGWPFHGAVVTEPQRPLTELLTDDTVLVAPALQRRLKLAPGDEVTLGEARFGVAGLVVSEPDQALGRVALAPRVLMTHGAVARTGLLQAGSRQQRKLLVALPEGADDEAAGRALHEAIGESPYVEVETASQAQPELREDMKRAERFLGLVALLSLVIGGAGVAQAARAWLRSRVDAIALMRCLGLRPRDVLALFLTLGAALGVAGSLMGIAAGTLLLKAAPPLLAGLLDGVPVTAWQPRAATAGLALGLLTALAAALPSVVELVRVPPLRALRSSAEPPPPGRALRWGVLAAVAAVALAAATAQAGSLRRGALFVGVLAATVALLALAARGAALAFSKALPARFPAWWRLAALSARRPGSGVASSTVALGLGVTVVTGVVLVQAGLRRELLARLPSGAPSAFLLDVQPEQWGRVRGVLESQGATHVLSTPMVTARLRKVNGRDVADLVREGREGRSEWALTREQRVTWWRDLPPDNALVEGTLWSDDGRDEVSIEEEFARELGLSLGQTIELDVQGLPVELVVTSLRRVEWRTFRINFFLVAEPGVLDGVPHVVLAAARLPEGREAEVQDAIVAQEPNVTVIPIRDALQRLATLVMRLASGVRAVGAFSVVAGLAILAGAVAAGAARRGAEIALLKTLGMTRREIVGMLLAEHGATGLIAGLIGVVGASVLSFVILVPVLELPFHVRPLTLAACLLAAALLAAVTGTLVSWGALRRRPIEALRREE